MAPPHPLASKENKQDEQQRLRHLDARTLTVARDAADALEGELAGERLFATVAVLGELLDVRSAFCADARLGEILGRHAGELKKAGVQRVRCSETYGTQVFERPL